MNFEKALSLITKLKKVRLCNIDDEIVQIFAKELNKI